MLDGDPILTRFTHTHLLQVCVLSVAVLLSSRWCLAQNPCPNNGSVTLSNEETLASQYQPYGNILHRYRFVPPAPYTSPYPTAIMLPPDVFKLEYGDNGTPTQRQASYDLQQAGFLVFQVDHRLAPPGGLEGQYLWIGDTGHFPEQTDDLKRQILAALDDNDCDGRIYLVGGSAGGTLALWVMLDSTAGAVTDWDENARSSIKAVVSLSGPTNFCDLDDLGGIGEEAIDRFRDILDNYVGLPDGTDCTNDPDQLLSHASPISLVATATSCPPVRLYSADGDTVPYKQGFDMHDALHTRFPLQDIVWYNMSYQYDDRHNHAYNYWHSVNDDPDGGNECVSEQVIEFLQAHP